MNSRPSFNDFLPRCKKAQADEHTEFPRSSLKREKLAGWNDPGSITLDRPETDLRRFETDEFKAKIAEGQKNASWYKKVRASITSHFSNERNRTRQPLFETGTIASSNSLIRNIDIFV